MQSDAGHDHVQMDWMQSDMNVLDANGSNANRLWVYGVNMHLETFSEEKYQGFIGWEGMAPCHGYQSDGSEIT